MSILKFIRKKFLSSFIILRPGLNNNLSIYDVLKLPLITDSNSKTTLCEIMFNNGSDKGLFSGVGRHNYTPFYNSLFHKKRFNKIRLFELGIGTTNINLVSNMGIYGVPGASLRGWKEYFCNGIIFGADIDRDILFCEHRIYTFFCDQTDSKSILNMWESNFELTEQFDIIIDDGLHTFEANKNFLLNSFFKLKKNGYYIIEDVLNSEIDNWNLFFNETEIDNFPVKYLIIRIPNFKNRYDNNLILIYK